MMKADQNSSQEPQHLNKNSANKSLGNGKVAHLLKEIEKCQPNRNTSENYKKCEKVNNHVGNGSCVKFLADQTCLRIKSPCYKNGNSTSNRIQNSKISTVNRSFTLKSPKSQSEPKSTQIHVKTPSHPQSPQRKPRVLLRQCAIQSDSSKESLNESLRNGKTERNCDFAKSQVNKTNGSIPSKKFPTLNLRARGSPDGCDSDSDLHLKMKISNGSNPHANSNLGNGIRNKIGNGKMHPNKEDVNANLHETRIGTRLARVTSNNEEVTSRKSKINSSQESPRTRGHGQAIGKLPSSLAQQKLKRQSNLNVQILHKFEPTKKPQSNPQFPTHFSNKLIPNTLAKNKSLLVSNEAKFSSTSSTSDVKEYEKSKCIKNLINLNPITNNSRPNLINDGGNLIKSIKAKLLTTSTNINTLPKNPLSKSTTEVNLKSLISPMGNNCNRMGSVKVNNVWCNNNPTNPTVTETNGSNSTLSKFRAKDETEPELEFVSPLQPKLEVVEGSDLELRVKIKGAKKVVWVKDDKIIPNIPPDFEYKSNPVEGTYSLKIPNIFLQDSGIYICEAYANQQKSDSVSWSQVQVIEDNDASTVDYSDLESESDHQSNSVTKRELIVPLIIMSEHSETSECPDSDPGIKINQDNSVKRLHLLSESNSNNSDHSSKENYEDALEQLEHSEVLDLEQEITNVPEEHSIDQLKLHSEEEGNVERAENLEDPHSQFSNSNEQTEFSTRLPEANPDFGTDSKLDLDSAGNLEIEQQMTHTDTLVSTEPSGNAWDTLIPTSDASEEDKVPQNDPIDQFHQISTHPDPSQDSEIHPVLKTQSSTESGESLEEERFRSRSLDDPFNDVSGSSVECNSISGGYLGRFRDSLSDNPLAPRFLMGPGNLIVLLGEDVNLRVKIFTTDEANTTVGWCRLVRGVYNRLDQKDQSPPKTESRIEITQPTSDLLNLRIVNVNYEDSGKYRVKIQNPNGVDYHHCLISVEGPPEPPPTVPEAQYDEVCNLILISWQCCPYDGGSAISAYILEMKCVLNSASVLDESWSIITCPDFKGLCHTLKNPRPSHSYCFRVCVENSHGKGHYSKVSEELHIPQEEVELNDGIPLRKISGSSNSKHSLRSSSSIDSVGGSDIVNYDYKDVQLKQKDFLEFYDKFEQLGKGRFGVVFKVLNKSTEKSYAGKFVKCRKSSDKERTQLEYKIMNDLKYHPKLICLVDAFEMQREIVIVTELINGGELFERVVADDFTLTERDCVTFLRQICSGVLYIHSKNIMHLDLKPENILCTQKNSNQIKIIDFGLAQYYNPQEPIRVLFGTAEFVSPEIINYETICPATDMWSVGVITYILLSGLSPFLGDDDNETFSNITRGDFDFEDEAFDKVSEDAKNFISALVLKRKEKRMTAEQCLEYKWLALSAKEKKDIVLPTDKLKRFLLRRKWQKTGNAIRALGRITTLYSSSRRSSSGSSLGSVASPNPLKPSIFSFGSTGSRSLSNHDSVDSVFGSVSSDPNFGAVESVEGKSKDDDGATVCSRSDSGICDVVSNSSNSNR